MNNNFASDAVKRFNKELPTSLHPNLPSNNPTRYSSRLLQSRVGREQQRYDGHTRLLACIVVSCRRISMDGDEFLLISSSKDPTQWILPKGGWENDESITESALREADEEAGGCVNLKSCRLAVMAFDIYFERILTVVEGDIVGSLGSLDFSSHQSQPCRFYGFKMQVTEVFEDWAENTRQRKWVSFDKARELLQDRPELVEMVSRAAAL